MKETNIMRLIMIAVSRLPGVRIFRNNTGLAWTGQSKSTGSGTVVITDARPLHAGLCKGSSDLIGWTTIQVAPEMLGKKVAIFTALETKTASGRATPEQLNFIKAVQDAGGIAGVARSESDALRIVQQHTHTPTP